MNLRQIFVSAFIGAAASVCFAQPSRILSQIDNSKTFSLPGRVHPLATAANDAGEVPSTFALHYMTMAFQPTPAQHAQLQQLLADQKNPASPRYRQWLTPEQYADQFGVSSSDMAQIAAWLQSQGFTVNLTARSRTFISFSGNAGLVAGAFSTTIHQYKVNGQVHFANSTDVTIPAALSPLVSTIRGLNDFHPKPRLKKAKPNYTLGPGNYVIAPDDFATIYDITPMYNAGTNGSGIRIAVVGQSEILARDITTFWSRFGITTATLVLVPATPGDNPGYQRASGDVDESTLDTEWAGAVARNATIDFVYSGIDVGVWNSAQYAVSELTPLPQVISMSYGNCEAYDFVDLPGNQQLVQQANAEGITWLGPAGDDGAADCEVGYYVDPTTGASTPSPSEQGLAVDVPGSIPEVTSMGGTAVSGSASYWNTSNTSTDESAKGYIPETAWNDTPATYPTGGGFAATGGGASTFFPQPSWQTASGVPSDGWRHVPDISFNASALVVPYYVYCTACEGAPGYEPIGGTSCAVPTMAGVVALLNQYLKTTGLGNINPTIYNLSKTAPSAFHNNITGNNDVPCAYGSPGCNNGEVGFTAGSGYSSAVGLGSLDVTKLIQNWQSAEPTGPVVSASLDQNPVFQGNTTEGCGSSSTWNFQVTLTDEAGPATSVTGFKIGTTDYSSQIGSIFGGSAIGAGQSTYGCMAISSVNVPANETFSFSGPGWSTTLTIPFQGPQAQLVIGGVSNAASGALSYAPGMILSVYGTGMGTVPAGQLASTIPFPYMMAGVVAFMCPVNCNTATTGWSVPLYYVGPNQINVQIPYEASGPVDLNIDTPYNFYGVDTFFTVAPVAPGIFMLEDGSQNVNPAQSLSPSQTGTVYVTGVGAVTPAVDDGLAPSAAQVPKPREAVTVTVGGVSAPVQYAAIPTWSVGVLQVNFTIPSNAPTGRQPVVVTVGTVSSPPAYITVQ
jgi:uncharacterized protein (TIGR03437 family)